MITTFDDLIAFLHAFHGSEASGVAAIPDDLPDGLARLYREFGSLIERSGGPFNSQDCLLTPSNLNRDDGMLTFVMENQGNWSGRCPLGPGDPPVYSDFADLFSEDEEGFVEVCGSLNHFLTTLCLQEAIFGARHRYEVPEKLPIERLLEAGFEPLWLDGQYVYEEPSHDFYEIPGENILLLRHRSEGSFISSPRNIDRRFAGLGVTRCCEPG